MIHEDEEKTVSIDSRFAPKPIAGQQPEPSIMFLTGTLAGATYWLSTQKELIIGREPENDVCIQDRRVSRQHARIGIMADGAVCIEDMGSTNGTYVNGDKIARRALKDGDQVHIGPHYMLKFCYQINPASKTPRQNGIDKTRDPLTGVFTKDYLVSRINEVLADARKHRGDLTLLMFDVDGFRQINAEYGESTGDRVLQEIVKLVGPTLRRDDVFARHDNDSFMILPSNSDESAAVVLAQRVRRAVKYNNIDHKGKPIPVTISLGIGVLTAKMKNAVDLIRDVQEQLDRAKSKGQDNINGSQSIRSILRYLARQRVA